MKKTTKPKKTDKKIILSDYELRKDLKSSDIVKTKKVKSLYTATIKVFGRYFFSEGATVREAIENMKVDGKAGGICVLSISKGEAKQDKILNATQLFRLFNGSRIMREVALKNVTNLFSI